MEDMLDEFSCFFVAGETPACFQLVLGCVPGRSLQMPDFSALPDLAAEIIIYFLFSHRHRNYVFHNIVSSE